MKDQKKIARFTDQNLFGMVLDLEHPKVPAYQFCTRSGPVDMRNGEFSDILFFECPKQPKMLPAKDLVENSVHRFGKNDSPDFFAG